MSIRRFLDSFDAQAICGVMMQLSARRSGLSGFIGSSDTTSTAANETLPESSASLSACSSMSPPREVLMTITPSFIISKAFLSSIFSLSFVSGQCSDTISAREYNSARSAYSAISLSNDIILS